MAAGLTALGIESRISPSRVRESDIAILLGTTMWRGIEATGDYLLVDRCSFGDTNQYVTLVWNGHGRRGDHCVPPWADESRWEEHGVELWPTLLGYSNVVICGQTETYSPHWDRLEDWYASIKDATHFRPHPAGDNPTNLPIKRDFTDSAVHVLNSSVGVEAVIRGRHVTVHDEGSMCWGIEDREEWAHWLAWTQWHHDEIKAGKPIEHLFSSVTA